MKTSLNRRSFLERAALTGAALSWGTSPGVSAEKAGTASTAASSRPAFPPGAWPIWDETEERALMDVLHSGKWGRTASGAAKVREFESAFGSRMKATHCVATSSGTTALLTALGALNIGPGDEVIIPPYTFVATFNAVTASYALPIFVDTDANTFQIDAKKIEAALTPATRLLLPVHIGGSTCDVDAIAALGKTRNIPLIEDGCQAPLAEWKGRPIGTFGIGGCFSFQASKNLTAGEGGAILTNDAAFADLCYDFHTPGGAKKSPSSGRGANYRMTEFQAGVLLAQFTRFEAQAKLRDENAAYLSSLLETIPGITPARLAHGNNRSGWHLYMFRYDKTKFAGLDRARFLQALSKEGISASSGYARLNTSAHVQAIAQNRHYVRLYGEKAMKTWLDRNQCPVNDSLTEEAVWFGQNRLLLPKSEIERCASVIRDLQKRAGELVRT